MSSFFATRNWAEVVWLQVHMLDWCVDHLCSISVVPRVRETRWLTCCSTCAVTTSTCPSATSCTRACRTGTADTRTTAASPASRETSKTRCVHMAVSCSSATWLPVVWLLLAKVCAFWFLCLIISSNIYFLMVASGVGKAACAKSYF